MCTVTIVAKESGYYLGMNRDEKLTRPVALPPKTKTLNGRTIISPSEPGGGTWAAVNDAAVCFALINWYSVPATGRAASISRGTVVNSVCAAVAKRDVAATLVNLPLTLINPFRLIGVFPVSRQISEWRWDRSVLSSIDHPWKTDQWASSSVDEPTAQRTRHETFRQALQEADSETLSWLRRLHSSHSPQRGAFSICMHRPDAATVSYVEVEVQNTRRAMSYISSAPCCCAGSSLFFPVHANQTLPGLMP